jgi:hypothetical protein
MSSRSGLLVTVGALVVAALSFPAFAGAARDRAAATTEFSAQAVQVKEDPKKKKEAPRTVAPKQGPAGVAPSQVAPRVIQRQVAPLGGGQKNFESQRKFESQKKFDAQKKIGPKVVAPVTVTPGVVGPNSGTSKLTRKVFTPRGNNSRIVVAASIRSAPARGVFRTSIRGRNYSVWRSGYRVRYDNRWRTFVALSALGVLAIGAAEYYPYAYIDAPPEYCDGLTEDGCQMIYDEVETEEGDVISQCVAYCPWQQ